MTTIYADFNALTEDRSIRLTTRGSWDDIGRFGVRPGDWVRLSDGEMQVTARVAEDPRYGLVGIPSWETLVDPEVNGSVQLPLDVSGHQSSSTIKN